MIKVITSFKTRTVRCPDCGRTLQYGLEDVKRDEYGFKDFIECPICGRAILSSIPVSRSYYNEFEEY